MSQPSFGSNPSPSLPLLDTALGELYELREKIETPGYSPLAAWLVLAAAFTAVRNATVAKFALQIGGNERAFFQYTESTATARIDSDAALELATNNTSRVLINSAGEVLTGMASFNGVAPGVHIDTTLNYGRLNIVKGLASGAGHTTTATFYYNGVSVGYISNDSTSTIYATTSDYRFKTNVVPLNPGDCLEQVNRWPLAEFEFLAVPGVRVAGAIAHELQVVEPLAVTGQKDGEEMQGVDWSKLVPRLAGAVQALSAQVKALQAQLDQRGG